MILYCRKCNKPHGEMSLKIVGQMYTGDLIDRGRGLFCDKECYQDYLKEFIVEDYKGRKIYQVFRHGSKHYIPYPGCVYSFSNLAACRERIDRPNIGIFPRGII